MIRSELVQALAKANPGLSLQDVDNIVSVFFDDMVKQLSSGGRVELRGFGTFSVRPRNARQGRNPRTGSAVAIAPKSVPHFKPGKEMRDKLNA